MSLPRALLFLALLLPGLTPYAHAEDDKKAGREREMLRRAQQALRQAETERAALQSEKLALEDKLKLASAQAARLPEVEKKLGDAERRNRALGAELTRSRQSNAELEKKLADANTRYAQLSQTHTESLRTLASRDNQIKLQIGTLTQTRTEVAACEEKNVKLYGYATELMQRYRDKGAFDALTQAEPVTGLKQARIDNLLEEYRDKLETQRSAR